MSNTTRRHPRTMEEAFGPYERSSQWQTEDLPILSRSARVLAIALALFALSLIFASVKAFGA